MKSTRANDSRPLEHILINVRGGLTGDMDDTMANLVCIAIEIGRRHRLPGARLSRYGLRREMYKWVKGVPDIRYAKE